MSLTITVYQPAEVIASPDPTSKAHNRLCMAEGTIAEILASSPPGVAIGNPSDSDSLWKYDPATGWREVVAALPISH